MSDTIGPEESGRPPIDAPLTEHRRWFRDKVADLLMAATTMMQERKSLDVFEALERRHEKLYDELTDAYMDGNKAERKTLEFKSNEFIVVGDPYYSIFVEEYADRGMVDPPRHRLQVFYKDKRVLMLYGLRPGNFDINTSTIRNINSEGP